MATPTPTTYTRNVGRRGITIWKAVWTAGAADNFSDQAIVDLSAQENTNRLKIKKITIAGTASITAMLEFDATADQLVAWFPQATSGPMVLDYTNAPDGGLVKTAAGGAGDLVLTTTDAADGQELSLQVEWESY